MATRGRTREGARTAVVVLALSALAVGAPGATAAAPCPDVDAPPGAIGIARSTAAVGCLVNHERTAAGLGALAVDAQVRRAAQDYAVDMATRRFFAHESPEGSDPGSRLLAAGFGWSAYGENIAAGQPTAREVMADWLASPGHCRNLMTAMFTVAGYGVATAADGPYWVQEFGRPLTSGVLASARPAPACPRIPTPFGATPQVPSGEAGPASGATGGAGRPATNHGTTAPTPTVRRSGRRLRIAIGLPADDGRTTVVVRVRQAGRTVRSSTMRRPAGTTQRMSVRLPKARGGRVLVRAGVARTVGVSFR